MKTTLFVKTFTAAALLLAVAACKKNDDIVGNGSDNAMGYPKSFPVSANYGTTNLVSDVTDYNPQIIDTNLVNAWGIAFGPGGPIWVSSNEPGVSVIYDKNGNTLLAPVSIPFESGSANPTGQVHNSSPSLFMIPSTGQVSKFIFATENGSIAAWASGSTAVTVADRSSAGAVYKGIEMVNSSGQWFLYATDFHNAKVDIFDQNFNFVGNNMFTDANIPAGFAPFNIRRIDSKIYVTYAMQLAPDNHDDQAGPGNGYVDIFNLDGSFVNRFVSQGVLNSPWGIEKGRPNSGASPQSQVRGNNDENATILIGNFGDGHINAFDQNGNFLGALRHDGQPLVVERLWAISYPPQLTAFTDVRNRLYFTAGPNDEGHGLFGFILH